MKGLKKTNRKKPSDKSKKLTRTKSAIPNGMTANAFVKAMKSQAKGLDPESRKLLNALLKQTSEVVDVQ